MKIKKTFIEGLYTIQPLSIYESLFVYDKKTFFSNNLNMEFIQDNESFSKKNVLRGIHIQIEKPQGKLVKVLDGEIFDVAVDLRKESKTYLKWDGEILSSSNNKMFYIPEGFAHGFLVLSDYAKIAFKVSNYWDPKDEIGIPWNDPTLHIDWPLHGNIPIIAEKDNNYKEIKYNNLFKMKE